MSNPRRRGGPNPGTSPGPRPVTGPAIPAPPSPVTVAALQGAGQLPPPRHSFGQNPTATGGIAAAGAPPSFSPPITSTSGPTHPTIPWYKAFWTYITDEGAAKVLLIFVILGLILSSVLGWYYWEDIKASLPTWAAFSARLLWLILGVIIFALLVYKKTWKLAWLTVIILIGGWLVIWGSCLLLKWAFIPTAKIVSIRDLGINPITAWIGDMSEDRDVRSPDSSLVSTNTPASTDEPSCKPQFKKVAIKRGETFLICNRGPGKKVESYTVWRLDQGNEPLRFKMNGPSGGMEDATLEQVTAKFAIATETQEKGPVEAERPIGDVYRHFGLQEDSRTRLTSRGPRSTARGNPSTQPTEEPSTGRGPHTDLLPAAPIDQNGVPIPPMPGEDDTERTQSRDGNPNLLLDAPKDDGTVADGPPTDLTPDNVAGR